MEAVRATRKPLMAPSLALSQPCEQAYTHITYQALVYVHEEHGWGSVECLLARSATYQLALGMQHPCSRCNQQRPVRTARGQPEWPRVSQKASSRISHVYEAVNGNKQPKDPAKLAIVDNETVGIMSVSLLTSTCSSRGDWPIFLHSRRKSA